MVFTGIIRHIGLATLSENNLVVDADDNKFFEDSQVGDSISINGICLTIVDICGKLASFNLSNETLTITSLKDIKEPFQVHLEKAAKIGDSIGGHLISGHVHGVGVFKGIDEQLVMTIEIPENHVYYKDSIAIDGVSLTIAKINGINISIALIPHTFNVTLFRNYNIGDLVNVEFNTYQQHDWMQEAVLEGEKGRYTASPNPWVGAVLIKNGVCVGRGYHHRPGEPHAEKMINYNDGDWSDCTLYVTLEPCHHYGRTPPCDTFLIERRVKKVVVGVLDPDVRVAGKGVQCLRDNGIDVHVLDSEHSENVRFSLRSYLFQRTHKRPYIVCKLAVTMDQCYADKFGKSKWITNESSRHHGHGLRAESQVVVVGSRTNAMDQPQLTARFDYNLEKQPTKYVARSDDLSWTTQENVIQILVEGGPTLQYDLLEKQLVHEFVLYTATDKVFGPDGYRWRIPENVEFSLEETSQFGNDTMQRFLVRYKEVETHDEVGWDLVEDAIEALQQGRMIVVMDKESRENEGDIMMLADKVTEKSMIPVLRHSTGIVCVAMPEIRAKQLDLPLMISEKNNSDLHKTNFTISVDAADPEMSTGVSAKDRAITISKLGNANTGPSNFKKPGHIFPLVARNGGLIERQGHTEAGVELAIRAGSQAMMITELYNVSSGKMMRRNECMTFARAHNIPIIHIDQIREYIYHGAWCKLPLKSATWRLGTIYNHRIFMYGFLQDITILRIHSDCWTGDALRSLRCDCGPQLRKAIQTIEEYGSGIIIFPPNHEGRGIGIHSKIHAYQIQDDKNCDTFQANEELGYCCDERSYDLIPEILKLLNVGNKIHLLTDNPEKIDVLKKAGYFVKNTPVEVGMGEFNSKYLLDKKEYFMNMKKTEPNFSQNEITCEGKTLVIIQAKWHQQLSDMLVDEIVSQLPEMKIKRCYVSGSFEIPAQIVREIDADIILAVGILVKGETEHFSGVYNAVMQGIMDITIKYPKTKIINSVLGCNTMEQVVERCNPEKSACVANAMANAIKYS